MKDLANIASFAMAQVIRLAEKFDSHLFHDFEAPAEKVNPLTLVQPVTLAEVKTLSPNKTNSERFEESLKVLIGFYGMKDVNPIDYVRHCLNAWDQA